MSERANPGPEYLRAEEWGAIRSRRLLRRLATGAGVVVVVAIAAVWVVRAPSLRSVAELYGAARHLESVRDSHVSASTIGGDDVRTLVWQEWRSGDRSRLQVERTGAVLIHRDGQDLAFDPITSTVREHRFPRREIDGRALLADLFERAAASPNLERLPAEGVGSRRIRVFRFEQGRERFLLSIDAKGYPKRCLVDVHTSTGWVPTHEFALDLDNPVPTALLDWAPPANAARVDMEDSQYRLGPNRVVATLPLGPRAAIKFGAVEMNAEGVLFVVVHAMDVVQPHVTDDLGTVYFRSSEARSWPSIPATEYLFVPMDRREGGFRPRTVTLRFPASSRVSSTWPARDLATLETHFAKPTCAAAPLYRQTTPGADYAALYEAEAVRGRHFERMLRTPDGRQIDTLSGSGRVPGDDPLRTDVNPDDKFNAARSYRRALALFRESGAHSGPTPATLWFRLFELVRSLGDDEAAGRALESAEAALREGRQEPMARDIRNARLLRKRAR